MGSQPLRLSHLALDLVHLAVQVLADLVLLVLVAGSPPSRERLEPLSSHLVL